MSKALIPRTNLDAIEKLLADGDLAPMTKEQRLTYMKSMCKWLGISIFGQPFDFLHFNGKTKMYANANCASQLRAVYKISIKIVSKERVDGLYVVGVEAMSGKNSREDADVGAVNIKGLAGQDLANAMMKASTKAKRRATLSLCGLGSLDADTVKELAEIEKNQMAERAVEESEEKLDKTKTRPEFESERPAPSVEPATPQPGDYILRAMKGQKGNKLSDVSRSKLERFVKSCDAISERGEPLPPAVQDELIEIRAYLTNINEGMTNEST